VLPRILSWLPAPRTALYLGLFLVLCALLVWRPLPPFLDFWGHAAVGRWIWEQGDAPRHALFLWTCSGPWVAHSWLCQLAFYGLTCAGPEESLPRVVLAFTFVMAAIPFVLIWELWGRAGRVSSWAVLPFWLALDISYPRFQPRPELFTLVFLAVELRLLVAWSADRDRPLSRADGLLAAALLAVLVAWTNCHGAVIIGLILLGTTAAADLVQDRANRRSRALALLVPLAALAVTANPYGLAYWRAYMPVAGETFARIEEWKPLWKISPLPVKLLVEAAALLALALLAWAANPRRRLAHLGWLGVLSCLFASAQRNAILLALVSLMVLAANARGLDPDSLWQALRRRAKPGSAQDPSSFPTDLRWLFRGAMAALLVLQIVTHWYYLQPSYALLPTPLAQGAVRFVREHGLRGNFFNDYENSSYLLWGFGGEPPLFIDLMNAYPDAVTRDFIDVVNVNARGRDLLARADFDCVLLTTNRPGPSLVPLAGHLDRSRRWMRVYAGLDGVIWVRRSREAEARWRTVLPSVSRTPFASLEWAGSGLVY
jgi:hypothetical protein